MNLINLSFIDNTFLKNYIKQNEDLFSVILSFIKNKDMKVGKNSFSILFNMYLKNKLYKDFGFNSKLDTKSKKITLEKNNVGIEITYIIDDLNKKEKYNSKFQLKNYIHISNIKVLTDKIIMDFYTSKYIFDDGYLNIYFKDQMIIFDQQVNSIEDRFLVDYYYKNYLYSVLNSKTHLHKSIIYHLGQQKKIQKSEGFIKENFNNIIECIIAKKQNIFQEYIALYNISYDEDETLNKIDSLFQELLN